jgi:hypothetical protein
MNDLIDGWSSPWRAFHKSVATAAPHAERKQDLTTEVSSWLGRARAAAETTRARPDPPTDH